MDRGLAEVSGAVDAAKRTAEEREAQLREQVGHVPAQTLLFYGVPYACSAMSSCAITSK